jgi:UDP-glucose 4-epimerase
VRVALIGGAGFIGCAVASALAARGMSPVLFDIPARLAATADLVPDAERVPFDFALDADAAPVLGGFDALAHLGATTHPARSMDSMVYDAASNIPTSVRLFEAAAERGIERLVFASSGGTVYGSPSRLPVRESAPTNPLSAYGVSKLAIEHYLALIPGVQGISLRLANPYGSFQLRGSAIGVIARYARRIAEGQPLEVWGDGSVVRDYIAVEDVAEAFVAALCGRLPAGTFNVGSGEGVRLDEIIALLFATSGRTVPVEYLPARRFDVPSIVLDCAALRAQAPWVPRIALAEGIASLWRDVANGR